MYPGGEVITGDAVAVDLPVARVPSRILGGVLDATIMGVVLLVVVLLIVVLGADVDPALAAALLIVALVGTVVGYPLLFETLTRGRSPGKWAMGLRVVRDDGGPIRFRQALTRALAGLVVDFVLLSGSTAVVAIVTAAVSSQGKRVGDLLAGTVVVRERMPRTLSAPAAPPAVPAPLAGWATGLELAALPDDLALAARQFLHRAPSLDPAARTGLAERLADDVAARVAPAPPAGVAAEGYLAAVLGERHRRETARLAGTESGPVRQFSPSPPLPPAADRPAAEPPADQPSAEQQRPERGFAPPG